MENNKLDSNKSGIEGEGIEGSKLGGLGGAGFGNGAINPDFINFEGAADFKRTDLAVEFVPKHSTRTVSPSIKRTDILIDKVMSKKLNRPVGNYKTVESNAVTEGRRAEYPCVSKELSQALGELIEGDNCLVVGLGNPNMTADALGKRVAEQLIITRHLDMEGEAVKLSCICPNVLGVTGIESFDIVKGVVDRTKPDCVIVVDSLAGASTARIASAFQVSDAGITPGSGVSNHRVRFDGESLGVKVVSIGVPLVVYASTIIKDAVADSTGFDSKIGSMIVTPKDVDVFVDDCAEIIAGAINTCFFGGI